MSLSILPDMVFPVTKDQFDPLFRGVMKLNTIDAGVTERQQRGLTLFLHIYDLWVKSGGKIDYLSKDGQNRLIQDAMTFCGPGNPVVTRHGDLSAAHLAIDFSDTQQRLKTAGWRLLSDNVDDLLKASVSLCEYPVETEKRVGLLMDFLGKRRAT